MAYDIKANLNSIKKGDSTKVHAIRCLREMVMNGEVRMEKLDSGNCLIFNSQPPGLKDCKDFVEWVITNCHNTVAAPNYIYIELCQDLEGGMAIRAFRTKPDNYANTACFKVELNP